MAGAQWSGGAYAGGKAAKAHLRHNDLEERLRAMHANEEIDVSLTPGNWSVRGLSYADKCSFYDRRVAEVSKGVRMSGGVNANNTMQSVCVYEPQSLDGRRLDKEQLHEFYDEVWRLACEQFGEENCIELDVHVDEKHNYFDPAKGGEVESRIHGHLSMVPAVDYVVKTERVPVLDDDGNTVQLTDKDGVPQFYEKDDPTGQGRWFAGDPKPKTKKKVTREQLPDGEQRLNHNAFASRKAIVDFNKAIDEMCRERFGMDYMTGEGKRPGKSVEQLKRDSRVARAEAEARDAEAAAEEAHKDSAEALLRASADGNLAEDMRREVEAMKAEKASEEEALGAMAAQKEAALAERDSALSAARTAKADAESAEARKAAALQEEQAAGKRAQDVIDAANADAAGIRAAAEKEAEEERRKQQKLIQQRLRDAEDAAKDAQAAREAWEKKAAPTYEKAARNVTDVLLGTLKEKAPKVHGMLQDVMGRLFGGDSWVDRLVREAMGLDAKRERDLERALYDYSDGASNDMEMGF